MNIFEVYGTIGLKDEGFNKGIESATKSGEGFSKSFGNVVKGVGVAAVGIATAAVGAATALGGIAIKSADASDRIDKMSQKLGISSEGFQEWDYVLAQNGGSIDSLGTGMKTLQTSLSTVSDEGSKSAEAFKNIGLSVEDVNKLSPEEAFNATVKALQDMPQGVDKTTAALDLFGKQGMELLPLLNQTAEGTEALKQNAHDLGMVMSDEAVNAGVKFGDTLADAKGLVGGMANALGSELLPSLTQGLEAFIGFATGAEGAEEKMMLAIDNIVLVITEKIPEFVEKGSQIVLSLIGGIVKALPSLVTGIMQVLPTIVETILNMLPDILKAGIEILTAIVSGIAEALPTLIPMAIQTIMTLIKTLIDNAPLLIKAALSLITALAKGLIDSIPIIIKELPKIIEALIVFYVEAIPLIVEAGIQLFVALIEALPEIIEAIVEAIPLIITSIIDAIETLIPLIIEAGVKLFIALVEHTSEIIKAIIKAIPLIITAIVKAFTQAFPQISEVWDMLQETIINIFEELPEKAVEWGKNLIGGFIDGIKSMISAVTDTVKNVIGGVADFLGFHSPAKKGEGRHIVDWGANMISGFGDGIDKALPELTNKLNGALSDFSGDIGVNANFNSSSNGGSSNNITAQTTQSMLPTQGTMQNITLNVNFDDIDQVSKLTKLFEGFSQNNIAFGGVS